MGWVVAVWSVPAYLGAGVDVRGPCLVHPHLRVSPATPSVGTCPSDGSVSALGPT